MERFGRWKLFLSSVTHDQKLTYRAGLDDPTKSSRPSTETHSLTYPTTQNFSTMQLKLVAVLFALAQVAPLVQAAPVDSAPGGHGGHDDFKCVSDTSFMRGGYEIQCAPGTYCEDVGAEGGSPCVSESSGGGESCPLNVDTPGADTTALGSDVQPTLTGLGDANVTGGEPTAAVTGHVSDATATAEGPAETDVAATMTDAAPGGPSATDVEPTAPIGAVSDATATADGPAATSDGPAIEPSGSSITNATAMDPTGSDLAVTGPTETGAAPADTTADGAPTVAAAFMRDRPKNGDWNAPAVPTADQVVPTTTATVPGAPDTAVVPAPVTSAALPVNQTAVIAMDSAVVPTAAAPAPGVFETTEHEAPFVTFQTAGGSTPGSCGTPLGTMHAALCESGIGNALLIHVNPILMIGSQLIPYTTRMVESLMGTVTAVRSV
jgi:hypothetical protein